MGSPNDTTPCPNCAVLLAESIYRNNGSLKSCPSCSVQNGVHTFYTLDQFGYRGMQIQTWCTACRATPQAEPPTASGTCTTLSS